MKSCPACSHQNPADALICESCGDPIEIRAGGEKTTIRGTHVEAFAPGYLVANRYEIVKEIGRGGMGVVYRARDTMLQSREMALKMIHPQLVELPEARQRFEQEVSTCLDLLHSNIVRVHNLEEWQGLQFFTMEYIAGRSLQELIAERKSQKQPFTLSEAASIITPLLEALAYAHKYTIHRDIKPDNIIIIGDFPDVTVKVLDFGIAKTLSASRFTQTAQVLGTAFYMAPEQMSGGEIDHRADLYSTGMIFYEMLTGEMAIGRFRLPGEIVAGLPKAIDEMLEKALASRPERRLPDAATMSHELQKTLSRSEAAIEATPGTERPKIPTKTKIKRKRKKEKISAAKSAPAAAQRNSRSWLYASVAIITLILVIGVYYWSTEKTIEKLKRETSRNPQNAQAWIKLARNYLRSKQYNEAIFAYQKSLKLDPQNATAWNNLGVAYLRNGSSKKAKKAYDQALNIDPQFELAWYNKGILLSKYLKDPEGALYCWKELAKINPSFKTKKGTKIKALIEKVEKKTKTLSKKPSSRSDVEKKKLEMASRVEGVGLKAIIGEWREQGPYNNETMIIEDLGGKISIKMQRPAMSRRHRRDSYVKKNTTWDGKNLKFTIRAPSSRGGYDVFYSLTLLDQNTLSGIKQAEDSPTQIPLEFKRGSSSKKRLGNEPTSSRPKNKKHATARTAPKQKYAPLLVKHKQIGKERRFIANASGSGFHVKSWRNCRKMPDLFN